MRADLCPLALFAHAQRGYNIGTRLIEDFLARTNLPRCTDFTQTAEILSKVGFKAFLNVSPSINYSPTVAGQGTVQEFGLLLDENPLAELAELPKDALEGGLWFSNVLCGVIRGALEMVCSFPCPPGLTPSGQETSDTPCHLTPHPLCSIIDWPIFRSSCKSKSFS